jgi:hypothetical protein
MSLTQPIGSDHQLVRLLQIGVVLEEVVEARAAKHADMDDLDGDVRAMLREAAAESAAHRERVDDLVADLDAETIPFDDIKVLVEEQYEADDEFDDVLYDQLCNEETAYKFYDDLINAIESSEAEFGADDERVLGVLRELRADEEVAVEAVTELMEER